MEISALPQDGGNTSLAMYSVLLYSLRMVRRLKSFRLSAEAERILLLMSERLGISQTAVLELALRDLVKRRKEAVR
jgi:hypothetical protein